MPKSAGKHKEANQLSGTVVHNLIPIGENFYSQYEPCLITYPADSNGIVKQPQEGGNKIYFALALTCMLGKAGLY